MSKDLQEIKTDIKRGRKYDVPNDYDCNYAEIYDTMDELVVIIEAERKELEQAHTRIKSLLNTEKILRGTISNLEYLYDKKRGALNDER